MPHLAWCLSFAAAAGQHFMLWLWLLSAPCQIPSVQSPGAGAPYRKHSSPCCSCVRCPPLLQHQFWGLQSLTRCLKACLKSMCQANLFTQSLGTLKWLYAWYRALSDLDIFFLFGHLFTIKSETLTVFFFGKLNLWLLNNTESYHCTPGHD